MIQHNLVIESKSHNAFIFKIQGVFLPFRRRSFHTQTWTREHLTLWKNFQWRYFKKFKKGMSKIQQHYLHTITGSHPSLYLHTSSLFICSLFSLLPGWKLVSQGALAVLKQFLESNLVRTFHISEHLMCLPLVCAQSNLIFSRNTWATNLPISVASWKHTGAGPCKMLSKCEIGVTIIISGKNQDRGRATLMALHSRWVGDINTKRTTILAPK